MVRLDDLGNAAAMPDGLTFPLLDKQGSLDEEGGPQNGYKVS